MKSILLMIRFPKDQEKRSEWLQQMHRSDWRPSIHSRICSDHFLEKCIDRIGQSKVHLKKNAVPTRFKKFPKHMKKARILFNSITLLLHFQTYPVQEMF